jgi:hypothetical protein
MSELLIYLSGSIQKGEGDRRESFWTDADLAAIEAGLDEFDVAFLNPATRSDDLADYLGTFGRDLFQVTAADLVWVDARDRRGIGVGAEMAIAKQHSIPVVSLCPHHTHYRRRDFVFLEQPLEEWIHPFVFGYSDAIVDDIETGCAWIRTTLVERGRMPNQSIQGPETVALAIRHYLDRQLARDSEMRALVEGSARLTDRVRRWTR